MYFVVSNSHLYVGDGKKKDIKDIRVVGDMMKVMFAKN